MNCGEVGEGGGKFTDTRALFQIIHFPNRKKRHEITRTNGPSTESSFLKQKPLEALKKRVHDMGQLQVDIFPNQGG